MILVRGRLSTDPRTASHASRDGMASANGAIECVESRASLETQLGDEGQGAKRDASPPRWGGRFPGNENNGIDTKTALMNGNALAATNWVPSRRGALNLFSSCDRQKLDSLATPMALFFLLA